jgi:hypothetical protein
VKGKITWPIEPYLAEPGGASITHIDDVPWAECSKEKREAALAALSKGQTKGEKSMGDHTVTMDEIKDLIGASKIQAGELFSVRQMKDAIRDAEAVEKARAEEHEKLLAEGEEAIAEGKRFKAAMDAIPSGGAVDKSGDAEPLNKYTDPAKNPMIKIGE